MHGENGGFAMLLEHGQSTYGWTATVLTLGNQPRRNVPVHVKVGPGDISQEKETPSRIQYNAFRGDSSKWAYIGLQLDKKT